MTQELVSLESSILERLVVPPESAQAILAIKVRPEDEEKMRRLMERNNKGTITSASKPRWKVFAASARSRHHAGEGEVAIEEARCAGF